MKLAIEGTCLCGAVKVGAARIPRQVTQCNCTTCRKYGTLWAYYTRSAVAIAAARGAIEHFSVRARGLRFRRCATCGCIVCWDPPEQGAAARLGMNARLFDHALMARVPVSVLDGDKTWRVTGTYVKPEMWISRARPRVSK